MRHDRVLVSFSRRTHNAPKPTPRNERSQDPYRKPKMIRDVLCANMRLAHGLLRKRAIPKNCCLCIQSSSRVTFPQNVLSPHALALSTNAKPSCESMQSGRVYKYQIRHRRRPRHSTYTAVLTKQAAFFAGHSALSLLLHGTTPTIVWSKTRPRSTYILLIINCRR